MRRLSEIHFASSNRFKYSEARQILEPHGIRLRFLRVRLEEIQSDSLRAISAAKAKDAFARLKRPVLVEDDGLFVDSLGGFPGPYSSYAHDTIGNRGILRLTGSPRTARFVSVITYCDGRTPKSFEASLEGRISRGRRGRGWGYDPIFVPRGSSLTFAQREDKNRISHRYLALQKFARWHRRLSSGR